MVSGNEIRLNRILRKGKMLCIPMDHGISNGPIEGLEDPASTIYKCEGHGLTSVIINKGILKNFCSENGIYFVNFALGLWVDVVEIWKIYCKRLWITKKWS